MRRRYYDEEDDLVFRFIYIVLVFSVFYLFFLYFTDRAKFIRWFIYGITILAIFIGSLIGFRKFQQKRKKVRLLKLLDQVRDKGQEDYVNNFINRFGFDGKKGTGWSFRNRFFEWERIADLEKVLQEKGIQLRHSDKQKDIYDLLRHYIQEKEENLTRESIKRNPQKFSNLSGSDFERLLCRLFEAMEYSTEWIGRSGDQGGDLIANKNGERILIQAKCYRDWSTGNAAVQQVVAAMKYYDCNKATVITTSRFTKEAITLAKANNTDLVSKEKLQELLIQHLKENWN